MAKYMLVMLLLACGTFEATAQEADIYNERIKAFQSIHALEKSAFGERMNLYKGEISFFQTDISIPGIGPDLILARSYSPAGQVGIGGPRGFGDWDINIPHIVTKSPKTPAWSILSTTTAATARCSNLTQAAGHYVDPASWWNGVQLVDEHGQVQELLQRASANSQAPGSNTSGYPDVTNQNWQISCLSSTANGQAGEAFVAISPQGTKYWFNWFVFSSRYVVATFDTGVSKPLTDKIYNAMMLVTRIEDRFGNYLTYNYTDDRLTSIVASDGRSVSLTWTDSDRIASISTAGRTWTYGYTSASSTFFQYYALSSVTYPDGRTATFSLTPFFTASTAYDTTECNIIVSSNPGASLTGTMTLPSGLTGTFVIKPMQKGRSKVPLNCGTDMSGYPLAQIPADYNALSLLSRHYSGPGIDQTWSYGYGAINASWDTTCGGSCATSVTVDETAPDGKVRRYTYSNEWGAYEGKLLSVDENHGGTTGTRTTSYSYAATDGMAYPSRVGVSPLAENTLSNFLPLVTWSPATNTTITQDGDTFTSATGDFDAYARPLSINRYSSMGYSQASTLSYHDNLDKWVLGQVAKRVVAGVVAEEITYDASYGVPLTQSEFGRLKQTLTYNSDGTVASQQDGNGHLTTMGSWKRGIPQSMVFADGTGLSAVVDDNGWITSVTDETAAKTCYGYDAMGRINAVTYPSESSDATCSTDAWNATAQTFEPVASVEYGIASGHWRQTVATGNARRISYYDAMWRPLLTREYDTANESGTQRFQRFAYDHEGRTTFISYPGSSEASTTGTWTEYDGLGRSTSVSQDSELGVLTTLTEYSSGFRSKTTDPRGQVTTTSYLAYDQPTTDWPIKVESPEAMVMEIGRDAFGKPTSITRRNSAGSVALTRTYVYRPDYQTLCKTIEPETGATVMDYDAAGNMVWSAAGTTLTSTSECNLTEGYSSGRLVSRSFDARNRLLTLNFPDGKGDQTWTYAADGKPVSVSVGNPGVAGASVTTYSYNRRRIPTGESLAFGTGAVFGAGYGYDANGHLSSLSYPSGLSVAYAPNALGQPTQVGTYATGISYYPNGAIKQFTYGNGIVHTLSQNARQLPLLSLDAYSGTSTLQLSYSYDANGNVASIADGLTSGKQTRAMTYDGLDRLTQATSTSFGTAAYAYDVLDNLTRVQANGRDQSYVYDSNWRLTNVTTTSTGATVMGLSYDVQGNLSNRNGVAYTFDYGNRLRSSTQEWYAYDGQGRRILSCNATACAYQMYDRGGQLLYTQDGRNGTRTEQVYLGNSLVAQRERPSSSETVTVKYQHTDALGSPIATTDSSRNILQTSEYEPYGKLVNRSDTDGPGFTGHVLDAATGMVYMQQRYYDNLLGVFISVDPVTAYDNLLGAFNRYRYGNGNPYKFIDPDGGQTLPPSVYQTDWTNPATRDAFVDGALIVADFTPVVGDIKGIVDAVRQPTMGNIVAAGAGLIPIVGDAAGKLIKNADHLIEAAGNLERLKGGVRQGNIQGDASKIIDSITEGGKRGVGGRVTMPDGTIIGSHTSKSTGVTTIDINKDGKIYKIRVDSVPPATKPEE